VLHYLFKFLHELNNHQEETKMNANGLSRMFGPNLIRGPKLASAPMLDLSKTVEALDKINQVVEKLIENPYRFFQEVPGANESISALSMVSK
jgi:hypothetical protein